MQKSTQKASPIGIIYHLNKYPCAQVCSHCQSTLLVVWHGKRNSSDSKKIQKNILKKKVHKRVGCSLAMWDVSKGTSNTTYMLIIKKKTDWGFQQHCWQPPAPWKDATNWNFQLLTFQPPLSAITPTRNRNTPWNWRICCFISPTESYCWWFRNPKQPPGMVLKPCK